MGLLGAIRRRFFAPRREPSVIGDGPERPIRGSYDAASLTGQNANHWLAADALDADSSNSREVRRRISQRARYEIGNNGQGKGVQLTQANYVVGRGPKLRMQTGAAGFNAMIEAKWNRWAAEVKLARKLRTVIKAKVSDGEAFVIIAQNPRMRDEVKLGLKPIECEQVTTPYLGPAVANKIDGVEFDEFDNPLSYDVLKYHPGGSLVSLRAEVEPIPARFMLHAFRGDRAGQHRGVSEVHPSLGLFAQSRRFRESTVANAENIANFTLFLKTQASPSVGPDEVLPMTTFPVDKSMLTALPYGFDPFQLKAEHPAATYSDFTRSQACEQARPLNMPYNIAAADSSGYSFSGGKLDHLTYFVSVDVEQAELEEDILEPLFEAWFSEAVLRYGWAVPDYPLPSHGWDWPKKPTIDEAKMATARKTNLSTGAASLSGIYAEDGSDFEDALPRMATDYGVTVDQMRAILLKAVFSGGGGEAEPEEDEDDEAEETRPVNTNGRAGRAANQNGNGRVRV